MPSISSTYLIPAIILNPAFILHLINTFVSYYIPSPPTASRSPHPTFEKLGPLPGSTPYMDMHADDQLCWSYTILMVIVQVLAFGKVSDNRTARKTAKLAKIEREKVRRENSERGRVERLEIISKLDKLSSEQEITGDTPPTRTNGKPVYLANGNGAAKTTPSLPQAGNVTESEESTAETSETSEEEMII
ncbi:hypothetical protein GLAREA_01865 [Glarea lozoyensis ATCC 20868]|uniref:Uncharacterized protein n=1 Tax=Glarea lozoyensis (strain ATCC 20868 / MF5171) TaxID=1116229 RepID=S3DH96_GLAL2|nr:uncharacterized protein GLAREA_01865 [Glarea lozoyensis ATCC 20868]EPE25953.1 hypothetical protein GLAREA_01865 [Glarea lozoyensis ATCC 20868]